MTDAELRTLVEAATPGPWFAEPNECQVDQPKGRRLVETFLSDTDTRDAHPQASADAAYIAAANPQTVLALLDRLDAVRALHRPGSDPRYCHACSYERMPCPTIRALDGNP